MNQVMTTPDRKTPGFYSPLEGRTVSVAAVVLAGDRGELAPWVEQAGAQHKLLMSLVDKPLLAWTLEGLVPVSGLSSLNVACCQESLRDVALGHGAQIIPSGQSGFQTMSNAVKVLDEADWVLCVSGDHVLVTPAMVQYFVEEALKQPYDIAVAVVERKTIDATYPEAIRTYFPFKDAKAYTGANLFLIRREAFFNSSTDLAMFEANRKFQWACLKAFSPSVALKILLRQASIHEVGAMLSERFRCRLGAIEMPFAEAAVDVDKYSDYVLALHILENRLVAEHLMSAHLRGEVKLPSSQPLSVDAQGISCYNRENLEKLFHQCQQEGQEGVAVQGASAKADNADDMPAYSCC